MKYNLTQSAEIAQVSRKTFRKHVVSKGISVEVDDNGNKWVDASELIRVYGSDVCKFPEEGDDKLPIKKSAKTEVPIRDVVEMAAIKREMELVKERLAETKELLEKEQIAHKQTKERMWDEFKNRDERLKQALDTKAQLADLRPKEDMQLQLARDLMTLKNQVAEQNEQQEIENKKLLQQNKRLQKALIDERKKSIWDKVFSSKKSGAGASGNAQATTS